jgi:hypothetical protein
VSAIKPGGSCLHCESVVSRLRLCQEFEPRSHTKNTKLKTQAQSRAKGTQARSVVQQRALIILLIVVAAFSVRALTANFLRAHLNDPGWFPSGIYAAFDRPAQAWLDGSASLFWIDDPSRTDLAVYPPGYPFWLALIYKIRGLRSPAVVQNAQWGLDSFSVLLIIGIGVTAFGWRVGLWAGGIMAVWPLPATYAAVPLADSPTSWIVLGAVWMMLLAVRRVSLAWVIGAGMLVGASCWLRANAMFLAFLWAIALPFLASSGWRRALILSAAVVLASCLAIAPVVIRNAVVFHAFVPTGLGFGTNLLEGIGETERGGREFGAPGSDQELIEQERVALTSPPSARFELYYPDGIERDRTRTRRALGIITSHPFWYAGTVVRRMAAVLKYAGEPNGTYGSAGINVTSKKCLPPPAQGGIIGFLVTGLGMFQSVLRYILLPLMIVGIVFSLWMKWRTSLLILTTVFYYLVIGSLIHTHIRYGLPMQALLTVFAGVAITSLVDILRKRKLQREDLT